MIKSLERFLKQRRERYHIPRRVQDLIPVQCIWADGIFRSGKFYSKSYRFSDINYKTASDEDKLLFNKGYCGILNGLEGGSMAQITIYNHALHQWNLTESELMPMHGDERDMLRQEYNEMISGSIGGKCFHQEKYITIAKDNSLASKRQVMAFVTKEDVVYKLFNEIAPKYSDKNGGYTRITKIGPRRGDAAEMAIIELL